MHAHLWLFHTGDSAAWAMPGCNEHDWDTLRVNFGNDRLPGNWAGFGWFRLWVKKNSLTATNTWGLYLNHDAASEVYFDGKKIAAFGQLGYSKKEMVAVRMPFTVTPVAITDTLPHLIAIRYSNYLGYFPDFIGFEAWMGDMQLYNATMMGNQRFYDSLLLSGAAQIVLILVHLLLFLFYPKNKLNLYYCAFVISCFAALYSRYLTITTPAPALQVAAYKVFAAAVVLIPFTGALLLYSISCGKIPKRRAGLLSIFTAGYIGFLLLRWNISLISVNGPMNRLANLFTVLAFADGLLEVFKAIRRGNKRLWLIAIGMGIVGLSSVIVGSNVFGWFTFQQVMTTMAAATLIIPVIFSIYLAMDVSYTTRNLQTQLADNKELAARNLAQEQEKTRLLGEQAEQLEKTVLERTAQVREQAARLQEMDEAKSRFFVNLTHEFKTPLTLIINPAKELLQQADTDLTKQYAGFILQNSERLLELINQLLDLSRLENGLMDINTTDAEVVRWLDTHVQQYASLAEQKKIRLQFRHDIAQLWIKTDLDKLEKIVQNLVSNAIKFSDAGGSVIVSFSQKEKNRLEISVEDNGIGIPYAKQPYVFDRFYQAGVSGIRSREGTGIGLALAKEMTLLLGGTISVKSDEKEGSVFTILLPYAEGAPATTVIKNEAHFSAVTPIPATQTITEPADESRPTVLVIEDNDNLRYFIRHSLGEAYHVLLAEDGEAGIAAAFEQVPDLVLTDLMMPLKDGYQVCDMLKNDIRTSHVPVIMLTAKTDQDSKIQGIETGADAYLGKPFDKQELLAVIEQLIRTRRLLKEKYGKDNLWLTEASALPTIEKVFLDQVREAIETNIDDLQLGPEQLGREIGLSRTQLHRKLKSLIDQSPGELIRTIRMKRAYELLQNKVATVAEVCYLVGYSNPANFSTSFSKHFGFPPSEAAKRKT
ncbi:ATP-binding protein [Pseudobacter ginsenosidimutans]|uniref:ATP-binding protein n=1 Tax=Pseudobacter ginsenosidimutans TaxID=661488 RepID=UPI001315492B|nr:ATP-binding protein [Pseudobacter ginsenosidimutans]